MVVTKPVFLTSVLRSRDGGSTLVASMRKLHVAECSRQHRGEPPLVRSHGALQRDGH